MSSWTSKIEHFGVERHGCCTHPVGRRGTGQCCWNLPLNSLNKPATQRGFTFDRMAMHPSITIYGCSNEWAVWRHLLRSDGSCPEISKKRFLSPQHNGVSVILPAHACWPGRHAKRLRPPRARMAMAARTGNTLAAASTPLCWVECCAPLIAHSTY